MSQEIEDLFFPNEPRITDIAGSVEGALADIVRRLRRTIPPVTIPMKSRLVYVLGALTHIEAAKSGTINVNGFIQALALAASPKLEPSEQELAAEFLTFLTETFTGWQDLEEITRAAVQAGWLDPLIADVPSCFPAVVTVDGLPCAP